MRLLTAGLAGLVLFASALGAAAQSASTDMPPPGTSATATPGKPSVETTTIADLIANDKTKAVLATDYPALLAYDGIDQIKGMTLRDISKFPQANLDDAKLAALQKDFDAIH